MKKAQSNTQIELTKFGNKIFRGFVASRDHWSLSDHMTDSMERFYDNGFTTAYGHRDSLIIKSYCEGDICTIICDSAESYDLEKAAYIKFFNEGC